MVVAVFRECGGSVCVQNLLTVESPNDWVAGILQLLTGFVRSDEPCKLPTAALARARVRVQAYRFDGRDTDWERETLGAF